MPGIWTDLPSGKKISGANLVKNNEILKLIFAL